jgi:hypothetical protein
MEELTLLASDTLVETANVMENISSLKAKAVVVKGRNTHSQ